MDQFKTVDLNMGLLESPSVTSWLDYESFTSIKNEDEDFSMEIIKTSDLEQYKELECIQEVQNTTVQDPVNNTKDPVSENTEDLKQSIMQEFFPEEVVKGDEFENNNALINEVEKYLTSISGEETKIEEDLLAMNWDIEAEPDSQQDQPIMQPVENTGSMNADQILEALTAGQVVDDSFMKDSITNTSFPSSFEAIDSNGEKVIVVIAPPSPASSSISAVSSSSAAVSTQNSKYLSTCSLASYTEVMSPGSVSSEPFSPGSVISSGTMTSSDDDDWKPVCSPSPRPRKKYERKAPKSKPEFAPYPKDKAERKKAQNRTAAWKYREKKKNEQDLVEKEFEGLLNRNIELKKTLGDMEIQLKVLKQLMLETGMAKYMP